MTLKEYLRTIRKHHCPPECDFKKLKKARKIQIAKIPAPNEILGVVISQDPTIRWFRFYESSKRESNKESRRKMLFASAIPYSLFDKIVSSMDDITDRQKECLFDILLQKVYWTHLHKCFTDTSDTDLKFKRGNAQECANAWLTDELTCAEKNGARFVIALGKHVKEWIDKKNRNRKGRLPIAKIIELPHPSGSNTTKWKGDDEDLRERIQELLGLQGWR